MKKLKKKDIIELWKDIGWNTYTDYVATYRNILESLHNPDSKIYNISKVIHPDIVSAKEFWSACEEHFDTDAVCSAAYNKDKKCLTKKQGNYNNYRLFKTCGGEGMMDMVVATLRKCVVRPKRIVEIGSGYGAFIQNYGKNIKDFEYYPFDVIPRFKGVRQLDSTPQGFFNKHYMDALYNDVGCAICFNVMQHFSKNQCLVYMKQVNQLLSKGGYFMVSHVDSVSSRSIMYGQIIDLFSKEEFRRQLQKSGFAIIAESYQYITGFDPCVFLCQK